MKQITQIKPFLMVALFAAGTFLLLSEPLDEERWIELFIGSKLLAAVAFLSMRIISRTTKQPKQST